MWKMLLTLELRKVSASEGPGTQTIRVGRRELYNYANSMTNNPPNQINDPYIYSGFYGALRDSFHNLFGKILFLFPRFLDAGHHLQTLFGLVLLCLFSSAVASLLVSVLGVLVSSMHISLPLVSLGVITYSIITKNYVALDDQQIESADSQWHAQGLNVACVLAYAVLVYVGLTLLSMSTGIAYLLALIGVSEIALNIASYSWFLRKTDDFAVECIKSSSNPSQVYGDLINANMGRQDASQFPQLSSSDAYELVGISRQHS